ncbi:MAG: hypothetical protein ACKVRP_06310 [Bacteroidota bacterium]
MIDLVANSGRNIQSFKYVLNNCGEVLLDGDVSPGPAFYIYHVERNLAPVRGVTLPWTSWEELIGYKMNDRGQIVGYGRLDGIPRPFLLSPVEGDFDHDGDSDLSEIARIQTAFTGALDDNEPGCERADIDGDGDVDLIDFRKLEVRLAGPSTAPVRR